MSPRASELLTLRPVALGRWRLGVDAQILLIAAGFAATIAQEYSRARAAGNLGPASTFHVSLLFVPIYEELLFRGLILGFFLTRSPRGVAIAKVSLLFGLWHLKNIFWYSPTFVGTQIAYTSLIFSPLLSLLAIRLRSAWPGVVLHYLNNLLA